ncbi:hypothetical protein ACTXOR_06060 [Arthrobacter rhombi]|uniref:hypothetical protein n=1 Tax=Arthrobacter rhombi TaxID=71253 RepID=UPI0011786E59|nr:hypothetical protein [Arthrobacter rhombi]
MRRRPPSIIAVSALLLLEAVAALAAAAWYATSLGESGPLSMGGRIFMLVLILGATAWQTNVGIQVFKGHAWTRAAAVVWQIFQVIFAVSFLGGGGWSLALGIALLIPSAAIILLIFDPKATAFFGDRAPQN